MTYPISDIDGLPSFAAAKQNSHLNRPPWAPPKARLPLNPLGRARLAPPAGPPQSDRMIATPSSPASTAAPADRPALPALLSRPYPAVMGVLNITPDSF